MRAATIERARQAGAADEVVAIGMANSAIAQGRPAKRRTQLALLGNPGDFANNFDYTMAQANIYRQQHQQFQAMPAFARANELGGEDDTAELAMQQVAEQQGVQLSRNISVHSDVLMHGVYRRRHDQLTWTAKSSATRRPEPSRRRFHRSKRYGPTAIRADLGKYPVAERILPGAKCSRPDFLAERGTDPQ